MIVFTLKSNLFPKELDEGPTFSAELLLETSIHYVQLLIKEGLQLNTVDYDKALYFTHRSQWDNLLILMVRTKDDFLSKKIEHFLHAYNFEKDYSVIEKNLYALLRYIDHASAESIEELTASVF